MEKASKHNFWTYAYNPGHVQAQLFSWFYFHDVVTSWFLVSHRKQRNRPPESTVGLSSGL